MKEHYQRQYVIKSENIPNHILELETAAAEKENRDTSEKSIISSIINKQKASLNIWFDYLVSPESDQYPFWFKFWVFSGILKLSPYKKLKNGFFRRTKSTTGSFPELNRTVVSLIYNDVEEILETESSREILLSSWGRMYSDYLNEWLLRENKNFENVDGKWIKFSKGSDHIILAESLLGFNTGWCTAVTETAENQLSNGDLHIYFSCDISGSPSIPRAAIRVTDDEIREIRGVSYHQNLDQYIPPVVELKLESFGEAGSDWLEYCRILMSFNVIYSKQLMGEHLSHVELDILYERHKRIKWFGYSPDPRLMEIKRQRNTAEDLSTHYNSATGLHIGDYRLKDPEILDLQALPELIYGKLLFENDFRNGHAESFPMGWMNLQALGNAYLVVCKSDQHRVVLEYDGTTMTAPLISAKESVTHLCIIEKIASFYGVPVLMNASLADRLYANVETGNIIPEIFWEDTASLLGKYAKEKSD